MLLKEKNNQNVKDFFLYDILSYIFTHMHIILIGISWSQQDSHSPTCAFNRYNYMINVV